MTTSKYGYLAEPLKDMSKAKAPPPLPPPEGGVEFLVTLIRSTDEEKFGMKYSILTEGSEVKIILKEIRPDGLLQKHNQEVMAMSIKSPLAHHRVLPEDEVLAVNGKSDPQLVKEILSTERFVQIVFRRKQKDNQG
mmetsp:Transcript_7173/g.15529  ORF Transcript_7173/g.15529 Transcript_7173/m.15529 type:complete len:136 (-) Transcript_7173:239-646(-)